MAHQLAPQVVVELENIWQYLATESSSLEIADRVIESIADRFLLLSQHPYVGRPRPDLRPGLRSFPAGPYVIFYRIHGDDVLILHVVHSHRDIETILGK